MTGSARDAAMAAIHRSLIRTRRPVSARWIRNRPHSGGVVVDGQRFHVGNGFQRREALGPNVGRRRGQHAGVQFGEGDDGDGDLVGDQRLVELTAAFGGDKHRRV